MTQNLVRVGALVATLVALAVDAYADKGFELDKDTQVLPPISHAGLAIFPVVTDKPTDDRDYLVLDEGMRSKKIKIHEKDADGAVNELAIENLSDKPAFLMAGEVVIGGKQDRIIGKNTIIEPRTKETIPVFCVEHGRWNGRKADFSSANALAHKKLREKASFGSQGEVWQEVADKNVKRNKANDTGTYRQVALDKDVDKSLETYQRAFQAFDGAADKAKRVGYVVALDGKVVAIEVFGSPRLFGKLEGKLRKSYFVEAIDTTMSDVAKPAPAAAEVKAFHGKARAAKKQVVLDKKSGKTLQFDDGTLKGSDVESKDGKPVYQGAYE